MRLAGMELHCCDSGPSDLSTLGGVVDVLKAALAAEERKKIIERNSRGRLAKAEAGKRLGKYLYYVCSSEYLPTPGRTCPQRSIRADYIDGESWRWLAVGGQ